MKIKLTFLYDGGCPLCLRETNFLKSRDKLNQIRFVDINCEDYNQTFFNNISYEDAMSNLHGVLENGSIIRGLDVLAFSYELIGLSWVYSPLKIKFLSPALRMIYRFWAKYRLQITGRKNFEKFCTSKCEK
tara:strand:- start:784 stop:1176 length:393 start_codon:yes stop_codon:yes gene_type:complete